MSTPVLGSYEFLEIPTVNSLPLLLGDGNTPSILQGLQTTIPAAGIDGRIYITTDTNLIFRDNGVAWVKLAFPSGVGRYLASGAIAAATGTSLIPLDDTTPLETEGTQIWSASVNCSAIGSNLVINHNSLVDSGTNTRNIIASFFLDSTCVGVAMTRVAAANASAMLNTIIAVPSTALTHTISCRVGINSSATWYVNRQGSARFNGLLGNNSFTIMEY